MKQGGAHLTKPSWSKPHPHPTNLALIGHKITLYIFNQGDSYYCRGCSNRSGGGLSPLAPVTLTTALIFTTRLWSFVRCENCNLKALCGSSSHRSQGAGSYSVGPCTGRAACLLILRCFIGIHFKGLRARLITSNKLCGRPPQYAPAIAS